MSAKPRIRLLKFDRLAKAGGERVSNAPVHEVLDQEQQIVWGEVYAPDFPDSQGDFMTAEDIKTMAHAFMRKSDMHEIDVQHDTQKSGAYIVESFIARQDDPTFIPGSWVIGVHIPDAELWGAVKKGELNGFSLDGFGVREEQELTLEMPEVLTGRTLKAEDTHDHDFAVRYDTDGQFMGGRTSEADDGHFHEILRGTCTEVAGSPPHSHRFSFIEGIGRA